MVGSSVAKPFRDEFYKEVYGDVTEMRKYCESGRRFVEGFTTRFEPLPGSNIFAWSQDICEIITNIIE